VVNEYGSARRNGDTFSVVEQVIQEIGYEQHLKEDSKARKLPTVECVM